MALHYHQMVKSVVLLAVLILAGAACSSGAGPHKAPNQPPEAAQREVPRSKPAVSGFSIDLEVKASRANTIDERQIEAIVREKYLATIRGCFKTEYATSVDVWLTVDKSGRVEEVRTSGDDIEMGACFEGVAPKWALGAHGAGGEVRVTVRSKIPITGCQGDWLVMLTAGKGNCPEEDVLTGKYVVRVQKGHAGLELVDLPDDMEKVDLLLALNGHPRLEDAKESPDSCKLEVRGVNEDRIAPATYSLSLSLTDRLGAVSGIGTFEIEPREDSELEPPEPCKQKLDVSVSRN